MHRFSSFNRFKHQFKYFTIRKLHDEAKDMSIPFARAKVGTFFQAPPKLRNQYTQDVVLRRYLQRIMPPEVLSEIEPDLTRFGNRVTQDIYEFGLDCEKNPPQLQNFDAWGNRIDKIITTEGWRKLKDISAQEGIVAIAYEKKFSEWIDCINSRSYISSRFHPNIKCNHLKRVYDRLVSRDPEKFWTSGQWMTERQGGSDVANGTETIAIPQSDSTYKLYGYKWFSSATDSDMAFTLARIPSQNGELIKGSKGVSMFYVETKNQFDGKMNNIQVMRLKDKLGTRQVPTGELLLDGSTARLASDEGRGIASITNMLLITRIHNAISSVAAMRRITSMARDYAQSRVAFGKIIGKYPLHVKVLADMELESRGSTLLVLEAARILGLDDTKKANQREQFILRLIIPICKMFTAKKAMSVISEGLEAFGGQGYMEDTGLPRLLRDAQVTPIWEGTTNIMALDVLRAIIKTNGQVMVAFRDDVLEKLEIGKRNVQLKDAIVRVKRSLSAIEMFLHENQDKLEVAARDFAFSLSEIYIGALLIEHASWSGAVKEDVIAAQRWSLMKLSCINDKISFFSNDTVENENDLVMEGYEDLK
uniref:Acyl-CoA dehydrogenase/oxidase C-terminal domain-containing protein n=1 Tax=Strigamia maritima TaxID=126957 RepID=T1J5D1_STRMM